MCEGRGGGGGDVHKNRKKILALKYRPTFETNTILIFDLVPRPKYWSCAKKLVRYERTVLMYM